MSKTAKRPSIAELKRRAPLGGTPTPAKALVTTKPLESTAVAITSEQEYRSRYLDEVAPSDIVGRTIKFNGKDGRFYTADDDADVSEDTDFIALCDETVVGWVRFNGPGERPDKIMGLLYGGFVMPERETLGDLDKTQWEPGLSGEPDDPWKHYQYLVLQQADTRELFTFVTCTPTGRRATGNLLRHYDRLRQRQPDDVPVVRLRPQGYYNKKQKGIWTPTPGFIVFGKTSRDSGVRPDTTTSGFLNDSIGF
jgi:hypothetical protein